MAKRGVGVPVGKLIVILVSCPTNNLTFVIPSEVKESLCEIAASLGLLAMAMYRGVREMTLAMYHVVSDSRPEG